MVSVLSSLPRPIIRPGVRKLMTWIVLSGLIVTVLLFVALRIEGSFALRHYGDGTSVGFDFLAYYDAALALRNGQDIYSVAALQHVAALYHQPLAGTPYLYPPLLAILLLPSTFAPYWAVLSVWLVILLGIWFATAFLLRGILQQITGEPWTLLVFGVVLTYGPVMEGFNLGQASILVLLGFCLILWLDLNGHDRWLGFTLALLGWIKIYPLILLPYYVARGRWDVVKSSVLWLILLGIPQFLLVGWSGFRNMLGAIFGFSGLNASWANQSLRVVPSKLLSLAGIAAPNVIGGVIALAIAAATGYGLWQRRTSDDTWARVLGLCWCICTLVLVIPVAWDHYYVWLIPPCVFGIAYCLTHAVPRWTLALASLGYLTTLYTTVTYYSAPALVFYTSLRPLGALCLWIVIGWTYLHPAKAVESRSRFAVLYVAGSVLMRPVILAPVFIAAVMGKLA